MNKQRGWLGLLSLLLIVTLWPNGVHAAVTGFGTANVKATVSFREGPSTSSVFIRYLKSGEKIVLLEAVNDYWYKASDSTGSVGYVSASEKYLQAEISPPSGSVPKGNALILSSVSFRTAPSVNGDRMRYLQKGERVTVTGQTNAYWYAVTDANGITGYVSASDTYIHLEPTATPTPKPTATPTPKPTATPTPKPTATPTPMPTATPKPTPAPNTDVQVEQVIAAGLKYLGTPYEYGSDRNTTTTFDCSDFVRQAFKDALNLILPADSRKQAAYVRDKGNVTTDWHQLKRGDLMFFMDYKGTKAASYAGKQPFGETVSHTGIYLGDGQVLHTYSVASGGVRIDSISGKHWEYRFLFGGSAL